MDRESVITHLQIIHTWESFARERDLHFFTQKHLENIAEWADDAIALLNEQEHKDRMYHALEEDWKRLKERLKEQDNCENCAIAIEDRQPVVRCKDCKHRPKKPDWETYEDGADIEFPDGKCPCQCSSDRYYSWYPDDEWFCAEGERKDT